MNEIYYCRRIFKERTNQKGDLDYIEDKDLQDIITKYRILLSRVVEWEGYNTTLSPFFKTKEELTRVFFPEPDNSIIILCKLEEFDKIMELYYSSKIQVRLN